MTKNLKDIIFKSNGERRIAHFLDENLIDYKYEPPVLVNDKNDNLRIWYPDFYLLEFGIYIEYYGMAGEKNYDKGIETKKDVYSKMGMDIISIYPWMFEKNWEGYIMRTLKINLTYKYKKLMTKPHFSKQKS